MWDVARLVDDAAVGRVVVIGSLPPEGRDLDVLARAEDRSAVAARLAAEGFLQRGHEWVRFAGCSALVVDLVPAEEWGLPVEELAALLEESIPLHGMSRLGRPAPHHALLILARLGVTEKRLARLRSALAEDPDARERAEAAADRWGVDLRRLRLRRGRVRLRRPRRRVVIAFSGVDGSGKSSQAAAAGEALVRLGHQASVVWLPITANPAVSRISAVGRSFVGLLRWLPGLRRLERKATAGGSFFAAPGESRRPSFLTRVWVVYVAVVNGLAHRRLARGADVVVFDRYVLDSVVRMRYLWAARFGVAEALLRWLSPAPALAFLLDVSPEVALGRKQDQWDADQLRRHLELYREEAGRLGVVRLDGTRPQEELCAEIAETIWRRLS
jgi:thymidylate kinase